MPAPSLITDTQPSSAVTVAGDQIAFTIAFSNSPPVNLQWHFITVGMTNDVSGGVANVTNSGVVSSKLTLNNLQPAESGACQLEAINTTNISAMAFSTAAPLTVNNVPPATNNIIVSLAAQTGLGILSNAFVPTWNIAVTGDLLLGSSPASYDPTGDFDDPYAFGDTNGEAGGISVLTDGTFGPIIKGGNHANFATCGPFGPPPGPGNFVIYALPAYPNGAATGYDLTNIFVYGGWDDAGRDEEKYVVSYSTIDDLTNFISITAVDFNPVFPVPGNRQTAVRTVLTSTNGPLARNVAFVEFNWDLTNSPIVKNEFSGYSELVVSGDPSVRISPFSPEINPTTASDVVGNPVVFTVPVSGAASYQWLKNGVPMPGATNTSLTLNNLQLTDAASYNLMASNTVTIVSSTVGLLTVSNVPTPVGNIITAIATQTSVADSFGPTWDQSRRTSSLIYNQTPSNASPGDFNDPDNDGQAGGLPVLTDGTYGSVENIDGAHWSFATCGPLAGRTVTYTLTGSATGYSLTNIQIAGGWSDGGRDQQAYTI